MIRFASLTLATLALMLGGCSHNVVGTPSGKVPSLYIQLSARPAELYTSEASVGRTVYFTLDVTNNSDNEYRGTATVASVAHFVVRSGDQIVWEGPELAMAEQRPVHIGPKVDSDYLAVWRIDNIEKLPPGNLVVDAIFTPTGDHRTLILPVGVEKPKQ